MVCEPRTFDEQLRPSEDGVGCVCEESILFSHYRHVKFFTCIYSLKYF